MSSLPIPCVLNHSNFNEIVTLFANDPSLRFSGVLPAPTIESVFRKHHSMFGGQFGTPPPVTVSFVF
ncbi:MAG: hypothetical protein LBQ50_06480 [Planctomycetaceae bacterium]|nr:hypothetical protein [Planctomycetaceae bacterium]